MSAYWDLPSCLFDRRLSFRWCVTTGAGITGQNVKQLVLATGAGEVHVGSGCHEVVARPFHDRNSVSLGPSEGGVFEGMRIRGSLVRECGLLIDSKFHVSGQLPIR